MLKATLSNRRAFGKLAFAAFLALTFCVAHPASTRPSEEAETGEVWFDKSLEYARWIPHRD